METRVEGSGAAGASSLCLLGALQFPIAAVIYAGLEERIAFGCTVWLN